ncbi:DUF192 domain-containing protein [Azoarcus sp. DN11]|uniref:DUF192 domain-containing protein n=1 Tax=Azoarcus sp. DN11 TaxID=356837 RepID=UPI000EACA9B5|nr:DUF192 domain-containing protein [Azoarcus sp. DN11]AYH45121.1 hypothetical protein CDA09_17345 [Azoarcus sp. DN11]
MILPSFFGRCAAIAAVACVCVPAARAELPMVELGAGMYRIEAELAHTDPTRQLGLMNRKSMPLQHGMVFVFTEEARHCMWMKNTLIPLSVAFMDRDGRILNVAEMQPQTEDSHCAAAPARFALEMNAGWFASRGLGAGTVIRGIDRLPAGR